MPHVFPVTHYSCSVSVDLGDGLLATVGNMLRVGSANVGFTNVTDTVAGVATACGGGVSTTTKAGRYEHCVAASHDATSHHSIGMVTGLRCGSGCTLVTSVPIAQRDKSTTTMAALLRGTGRWVGSVTLAFPPSQSPALQDMYVTTNTRCASSTQHRCLSNQLILAASLGMHISTAIHTLQRTASALSGNIRSPLPPPCASLHVDTRISLPPAAPEDVEAEQSYSDLDEEYRRELLRECCSSTSSCEDDAVSMQPCSPHKPWSDAAVKAARRSAALSWWLHMGSALLLALVIRKDLVLYGILGFGVLAVWVVTAIRDRVLPPVREVAVVALTHALACVVPTPIWRTWRVHASFWWPWVQRMLADPATALLAYTVAVTTVIAVACARRRMGCQ